MKDIRNSPFECHVFVCVNDRHGQRKSCADGDNAAVRQALKDEVARRGWKAKVRVSQCGCLGLCESGPNVMIYPHGMWFSEVTVEDVQRVLAELAALLDEQND